MTEPGSSPLADDVPASRLTRRADRIASLAGAALLAAIYLATAAPCAWWGDGLELSCAAWTLGVAHPTVSKTIARLKREGLATARPYRGIFLTEAGVAMAKSARQRHRLVVDVLLAIGAPREAAEADAEGIEHYVSAATLRAFEAFLRESGRR